MNLDHDEKKEIERSHEGAGRAVLPLAGSIPHSVEPSAPRRPYQVRSCIVPFLGSQAAK